MTINKIIHYFVQLAYSTAVPDIAAGCLLLKIVTGTGVLSVLQHDVKSD